MPWRCGCNAMSCHGLYSFKGHVAVLNGGVCGQGAEGFLEKHGSLEWDESWGEDATLKPGLHDALFARYSARHG